MPESVADELKQGLRRLAYATIGLFVALVLVGGFLFLTIESKARQATEALCTFRADLETRVQQSEEFIAEHPEGFEGISVKEIQQSLDNQKRTIEALSSLDCEEAP